jgi:hypothetical protein
MEREHALGDFNLQHPYWGGINAAQADEGTDDVIWITGASGLELAMEPGM